MAINTVTVSGNLTRDPELRVTASGTTVLSLGIAVNDRTKNNMTGEWEDYANFFDCTMFGTRAESLSRLLYKGIKVTIFGKLHYSAWEDRQGGGKRSKVEIIAEDVDFLTPKGDSQPAYAPQAPVPQNYQAQPKSYPQTPPQAAYGYSQQPDPLAARGYQQVAPAARVPAAQAPAAQMAAVQAPAGLYDADIPF